MLAVDFNKIEILLIFSSEKRLEFYWFLIALRVWKGTDRKMCAKKFIRNNIFDYYNLLSNILKTGIFSKVTY